MSTSSSATTSAANAAQNATTLLPPPSTIALPTSNPNNPTNGLQQQQQHHQQHHHHHTQQQQHDAQNRTMVVRQQFDNLRRNVLEFANLLQQQQSLCNENFLQVAKKSFSPANEMLTACRSYDHHVHLISSGQAPTVFPVSEYTRYYQQKDNGM
ncbi:hypothetical protein BC940DRAFT_296140, partial [Gongronella butleri]